MKNLSSWNKDLIIDTDISYIIVKSWKDGSNIIATIFNGLIYMISNEDTSINYEL